MDFHPSPEAEQLRAEIRAFLDGFMTPEREEELHRTGVSSDPDFTRALVEHGWIAPAWPVEWGGGGLSAMELIALSQEYGRYHAPHYATVVTVMVARAVHALAPEALKAEIIPKALGGEITMVLGFTEPGCGSDVANAQCRAVRDGDEWVVNGSKMFTTNAQLADYVFLLTRTNTEVAKHKGLTTFLVPMKQAGVEIQAVYTLSGERTNVVFFTDVRIPDELRIGEVDGGWTVMSHALADEHSANFGTRIARLVEDVEAWARETGRLDDPDVRARIARAATEAEVAVTLQERNAWLVEQGLATGAEGPAGKLLSSEALVRAAQDLFELMGPDGTRVYFDPTAPVHGRVEHTLRYSLGTTIYAGTSEVQRNIVAQRGLGLPRG